MPSEPFIAEIYMFAGNFAPRGTAFCQGQILPIALNQPLFILIGTTFGGDGINTFALPDLRGRSPVGTGQGPGLESVLLGQVAGVSSVNIAVGNLPAHTHPLTIATSASASTTNPAGALLGNAREDTYASGAPVATGATVGATGGAQPLPIRNPYLGMNFTIALEGIFPSQG